MTFKTGAAIKLFLVLISCSCGSVWGDKILFSAGNEYSYSYDTLVTTGTEEPTGFAAAYKIHGTLRIQAENSNTLNVKLDDLTIGLYNGPWTYFPMPTFTLSPTADLSSLEEPFQIQTENGMVKILVMNDQEPEWASNMKRGIATFLQIDLSVVNFDRVGLLKVNELTTMGECETHYEIMPAVATKTGSPRISKFRNHADCQDIPSRTRFSNKIFYACPDKHTKNIINSTSYSTYELDDSVADRLTIKSLTLYSSALYWPFTVASSYLYNWLSFSLGLISVSPIVNPIQTPENPENHEDLTFVFEQNDLNDPEDELQDLRLAEPLMFHHTSGENDPGILQGIMEQLHRTTAEVAQSFLENINLDDLDKFHRDSPFVIIPLISSLDFDSLTHCYQRYSDALTTGGQQAKIEFQLFLDGLTLAGNGPAALTIRDILLSTQDGQVLSRLIPSFPHFIRNPSEALAKDLDPIFELTRKPSLSKPLKRMLELSMASLISKCCQKTMCTTTGLLDKYIRYFEDKLGNENFEIQTVGVIGLRNLGVGNSLNKLLDIATNKIIMPESVRVQAIWSLRPLAYGEKNDLFESLLPIFYNRSEPCETRTSVFSFLMSCRPEKRILHEIAYFMWSESCPQTSNIVRSTLINLGNSKHPCGEEIQSYARTILKYLPPGAVDPTRTTSYAIDYYDEDHGFGHQTYATVQKYGTTSLPISVYIGLNGFIGGFATGYMGLFVRMEGLGKAVTSKLAALRSANVNEIQSILSLIGVRSRPDTPLKLELAIMYHEKVIVYYAADERTLDGTLPQFLKKLGDLKNSVSIDWQQSLMLGGVLYQQPMEIGVPITVVSSISAMGLLSSNVTRAKAAGVLSQDAKQNLHFNTFGITQVSSHLPSLGTTFSVTLQRALRVKLPRQFSVGIDIKNQALNLVIKPPAENNPSIVVAHATSKTSVTGDYYGASRDLRANELLQASCPTCSQVAIVSKGEAFRKSRTRDFKPRFVKGVKATFKYFDCERAHSRSALVNKLKHILDPSSKNTGIFQSRAAKASLGIQQATDALFLSPHPETCGVLFSLSQDNTDGNSLEQVDAKLKTAVVFPTERDPKWKSTLDAKVNFNYASGKSLNTESYLSVSQSAVNHHELNLKFVGSENDKDKIGVLCLNVESEQNFVTKDLLSYTGDNVPHANQTAHLRLGKLPKAEHRGKDTSCSSDHAEIHVNIVGEQSEEQLAESQLDILPYKACRDQQAGPLYPGSAFVPPIPECYSAALEQTSLRRLNISVNYKIAPDVRKRWRKPLGALEGLLIPYYVDSEDSNANVVDHQHGGHAQEAHHPDQSGMSSGEIEIDLNIKRDEPTMDIHYHRGEGKEQHFHGVELNLLPEILRPKPVPTRFTPFRQLGIKLGLLGICSVSPAVVQTLDGVTIPSALPECLTLISGDCSRRPQYVVLAKRTSPTTLALQINIQERKIEIDGSTITLDGQSLDVQDGVVKEISSNAKIHKNGQEINVMAGQDGLYMIRYTGGFVTLGVGSRYRGVHCGICGSWDSAQYNDFSGPDTSCPRRKLNPSELMLSYVKRDGDCSGVGQACPS